MKKQQIPLGIALLSMVILAGCGGNSSAPELSSEVLSTEAQHETEKIAVTLVNASNLYLREVIFTVPEDENYEGYGALADVDGLDPGDTYVAEIPVSDQEYQIEAYDVDWEEVYGGACRGTVEDGSVIVLLPEENGTQMIYAPGTDPETAREEASTAYGLTYAAEQEETEQQEEALANEELAEADQAQEAAKAMGYESVANMRFFTHEGYNRDDAEFPMLTGYWYPDGDENSLTYFAMDNRDNLRWYRFDENDGDVETEVDGIRSKVLDTYTLNSGKKFTMKHDTIVFDGDDVEYRMGTY